MGDVKWSDVKRIAQEEIGYTEGYNNKTKYAADLDAIGYFNGPKQHVAWCGTFDYWCIWKASDPDPKGTALAATYQPWRDNCACACRYGAEYFRTAGKFYNSPEEGDIAFYGKRGSETHQGFVEQLLGGGYFYAIEGNHGDRVARVKRHISECSGFGRPWYTAEDSTPDPKPASDEKYSGTWPTLPKRGWFAFGDKGVNVKRMQEVLEWVCPGCLPKYGCDGEIGSETIGAVKRVQEIVGTTVDGLYGPKTQAACKAWRK